MSGLPPVGAPAPDFTLASTDGSEVTLSQLRGNNVLLAFFPLAFTRVCTTEMCAFSAELDRFRATGTTVLPISVDAVPSLKEFKAKERLSVDLLSDFKREVCGRYGTLLEDKFYSGRAYVLIDTAGIVRWTFFEETPSTRRENDELLRQIQAL
jgi:peroxiredoxin